ncbi:MAG: PaaI family thioesterase [Bryobacterales bacterium]|nr:PaaI family thioesterase [Bryobacterales bacterium]
MERLNFNRHLGLRVTRVHRDGVTVECPIRHEYLNLHGTLHGGVTATLVDVAAGFAAIAHGDGAPVATVKMKINYFLPLTGRKVIARAKVLRAGSTLYVCQVEVFNEHRKLAGSALVTYMKTPLKP